MDPGEFTAAVTGRAGPQVASTAAAGAGNATGSRAAAGDLVVSAVWRHSAAGDRNNPLESHFAGCKLFVTRSRTWTPAERCSDQEPSERLRDSEADMGDAGHRAELVEVIRQIRNRWRLKLALRGVVVVVAGSLLALLLSASGLEALRFSAAGHHRVPRDRRRGVRGAGRGLAVAAAEAAGQRRAGRAVSRGARSVARSLDSERGRGEQRRGGRRPTAIRTRSSSVSSSRRSRSAAPSTTSRTIEREGVRRHVLTLAGVAVAAALLIVFGPAFLRQGLSALLVVYRSAKRRRRTGSR